MTDSSLKSNPDLPAAKLLGGVRILDLTNILSGPYCTFQLAMIGAEVIKIENPEGGDLARQLGASPDLNRQLMGTSFLAQNAGKKSIALNLKEEADRAVFKRLVATADVVVENFRPGVMARFGLGYEVLRTVRPDLIYCAISGFGQAGPLSGNPAYDQIIQGLSGVMSITGDAESAPLRVGYPLCDTLGGLSAALAIVSSLFARQSTGEGRFIDVSMLDATVSAMGWAVSNYLLAGVEPSPIGNQNMTAAPSGVFQCADGPINIAANRQTQYEALCRLIGRNDLVSDPRFAERETRKQNRAALNTLINEALAARPAAEWEMLCNVEGVPAGRVLSVPEILAHEQTKFRRLLQEIPCDRAGIEHMPVVRPGFRFGDCEPGADMPPPWLGEHTAEILTSIEVEGTQEIGRSPKS